MKVKCNICKKIHLTSPSILKRNGKTESTYLCLTCALKNRKHPNKKHNWNYFRALKRLEVMK